MLIERERERERREGMRVRRNDVITRVDAAAKQTYTQTEGTGVRGCLARDEQKGEE